VTVAHPADPVEAPDCRAAVEAVRATGLRVTTPRRLLIEALWNASEPLSAEQLSELAGDGTDVASVYRNLEAFERIGLIRHFHVGHGPGLYARTALGAREYLICDACGRVEAVEPGRLDGVRELIRRDFGHEASFTHFPIAGLCRDCSP
jgi:Fur family transcriptional regulator, ferric uptake regulator